MDAILSLPLLSYLVLPSFGAYSTSLNLLFFYLTWSTLILSHPPITVEVVGTTAIRLLFFLIPSLLFLLFDTLLPSLSKTLKTQGVAALPIRPAPKSRRRVALSTARKAKPSLPTLSQTNPPWYQVLALSIFNIVLGVALQALVEHTLTKILRVRSALKVATALPFPWAIAKDLSRGFVVRELLQWTLHRYVLHSSTPLATLHNKTHHALTAPYAFVAHYDHPLSWIVWRWLPTYGAAALFRFHLLTYFLFLGMVSVEESVGWSGYDLNSIVMGGLARRQDAHLESKGQGNYAAWGVADWIAGTSVGADVADDARDEWEKHDGAERTERIVESAKAGVREGVRAGRRRGAKRVDYDE